MDDYTIRPTGGLGMEARDIQSVAAVLSIPLFL
jgi:hypothetical protein